VKPNQFIQYQERRLRRPLTVEELDAVNSARATCPGDRHEKVKSMWAALQRCAR